MEQFVGSDLVLLTLTVGFYCLGSALYSRTKFALLHPVLLGFVAMILYLKLFGIGYEHYRRSTELLNFGLGLSVVALGYLMYEQLEHMRGRLLPILVSVVVGCVVGVLSVVYLARMLGADRILQTSLAPKSVTVPIAVSDAATAPAGIRVSPSEEIRSPARGSTGMVSSFSMLPSPRRRAGSEVPRWVSVSENTVSL